ncbi:MAG: phosphoglycerate kinase [Pseudomonadota bacterium]
MAAFKTLDDVDLAGKRCLVRVDLNVPMNDGKVSDETRIERVAPTVREISEKGGKVILLAHFGRPKGKPVAEMSLEPITTTCVAIFGKPVSFINDCVGPDVKAAVEAMADGDVLLLENTRFYEGEEKNDPDFASQLAENGDMFVADAFSAAHRAHASTAGLADHLPAIAGRTMQAEVEAIEKALAAPKRPVLAVVGGAKVSTKIELLENLVDRVDMLAIGGGMANTFLAAEGINVGRSLCEHDLAETALGIINTAKESRCELLLPDDVVVAKEFKAGAECRTKPASGVLDDEMILDAGPATVNVLRDAINNASTVLWNGPLGAFEIEPFDKATVAAAKHAAAQTKTGRVLSVAGGGDTVAALNHAGVADSFSYVSTAGGAFLEWLEGKELPGVEILRRKD